MSHLKSTTSALLVALWGLLPVPMQAQTAVGSLSGHAFVAVADGSSQLLRGHEVSLLCGGVATQSQLGPLDETVRRIGNTIRPALTQLPAGNAPFALGQYLGGAGFASGMIPRILDAYWLALSTNVIRSTRTSVDGAFRFDSLPAGEYVVVARYVTPTADAVWHLPVIVLGAVTADLASHNAFDLAKAGALPEVRAAEQFALRAMAAESRASRVAPAETAIGRAYEGQRQAGSAAAIPPGVLTTPVGSRGCRH